ncbi:aldehyde dehydrogenase, partial [Escherichia coli]|nr:aldehyde dehydrogenase [Escherichia coli]MBB8072706.1 aldehyde dehydrogenase [Escherichia coli]
MSKVGINGFGRIGRLVLRRLLEVKSNIDIVACIDSREVRKIPGGHWIIRD